MRRRPATHVGQSLKWLRFDADGAHALAVARLGGVAIAGGVEPMS